MIELYQMQECPFCVKVRNKLEELNLSYISHPCLPGSPHREELEKLGGRQQVPFINDSEKGISMYESSDIVDYLEKTYGNDN